MIEHATYIPPTAPQKTRVTVALADFCALDIRPFYVIEEINFRNLLQTMIDIGIGSKKRLIAAELLPTSTTIRHTCRSAPKKVA